MAGDRADDAFAKGRQLVVAGKCIDAIPLFEESHRLSPSVGALINLADCYVKIARLASGYDAYRQAAELARRAKDDDRDRLASDEMKRIEKDVPRVRLIWKENGNEVSHFPGSALVRLDGKAVSIEFSRTVVNLVPGEHELRVEMPGRNTFSKTLRSGEHGSLEEIVIDLAPTASEMTGPSPIASKPVEPKAKESNGLHTAGWVALAGGGVVMGAGAVLGGIAWSQNSKDNAKGGGAADASTILFVAGGAVALSGLAILLLTPKEEERKTAKNIHVAPAFFANGGSVALSGTF